MATYLRDWQINNIALNISKVEEIFEAIISIANEINSGIPAGPEPRVAACCVIRYNDGEGVRVYSKDQLLILYRRSTRIERLIFLTETVLGQPTRPTASVVQVNLDTQASINFLTVTSENPNWVQANFNILRDMLKNSKNFNGMIRNAGTQLLIQLLGVGLCFFFSVTLATWLEPRVLVKDAFILSFVFAFLVLSNLWVYIQQIVAKSIVFLFPNIRFVRVGKEQLHWLPQAIFGTLLTAAFVWVASEVWAWAIELSGHIIK